MINQVVANPDYTSSSNQYGFYAIPKTIKPKSKYREDSQQDQESDEVSSKGDNVVNTYVPLQDEPEDERALERDYFVDEAPWADFKKKEPGLDYGVQVEDRQLFDFDREVEPLLQILVGRSILKARNELQEDQEKQQAKAKLVDFQKKRNAELMVTQRLEAQHMRKVQEADRRVLQHKIFKEQKKITVKKVIAYTQAKKALSGLRQQVLGDLESEGFLRYDPIVNLRTDFEPWLYDSILQNLNHQQEMNKLATRLLNEQEDEMRRKHKQNQHKEQRRRKQILDQRERERLENEQRKRKKAIRKHRKQLNAARIDKDNKLFDATTKAQKIESILKAELSDNLAKPKSSVYISGGIVVHLLETLQALEVLKVKMSEEQVEDLVIKILTELNQPLDVCFNPIVREEVSKADREARQNVVEFHSQREETVSAIMNTQLPGPEPAGLLNYEILRTLNKKIDSSLVHAFIKAVLNIYFVMPAPEPRLIEPPEAPPAEEGAEPPEKPADQYTPTFVLTEREKQRLAVKGNLSISYEGSGTALANISDVVRLRFPLAKPEEEVEQEHDDYIQIYDGEGWIRTLKKYPKRKPQAERTTLSVNFAGFDGLFVYDQISDHFFETWVYSAIQKSILNGVKVQQLLEQMQKAHEAYEHVTHSLKKDSIPIYDIECEE